MTALAAAGGAAAAVGCVLLVRELVGVTSAPTDQRLGRWALPSMPPRRLAAVVGVPIGAWVLTDWPVAALAALAAVVALPRVTGGKRAAQKTIVRLEALATWVRRVADLLGAGLGLEQALQSSARSAPQPLADEIARLAWRLRAGTSTETALRAFADDIGDPTGDLVAAALILASNRRGRGLARILTALATTIDDQVAMRRRVEADRATPRTTVRYVTGITVAAVAGLVLLDRTYLEPFSSAFGQLVLAVACGLFAAAFLLMHRLVANGRPQRFLPASTGGRR